MLYLSVLYEPETNYVRNADSLCKLTTVGSVHYNEPVYKFNRIKDLSKYDKVLVEDWLVDVFC